MTKEQKRWWLEQCKINPVMIHWIINWNAGLNCFGGKVDQLAFL